MRYGLWCRGIDYIPIDLKIPAGGNGGDETWHPYFNRSLISEMFDDFLNGNQTIGAGPVRIYGQHNWTEGNDRVIATAQTGGVVHIGNNAAAVNFNPGFSCFSDSILGEIIEIEWRIQSGVRPTIANSYIIAGLYGAPTDFIGIGYDNAGNFWCIANVGGARTINVDSGVAFDGNWHRFRLVVTSVSCEFYIDNNLVHTDVNPGVNYPLMNFLPSVMSENNGWMYVDWCYAHQTHAAPRDP